MTNVLMVNEIEIQVIRKDIKNLHLRVLPPDGFVRVSAPRYITDENIRLFITSRINWIKKRINVFIDQPGQTERKYVSGECHYYFGRVCYLQLIERKGKNKIELLESNQLVMYVNPGATITKKCKLLNEWYRTELKRRIPDLINKWQPVIGKSVSEWGVKNMKTRWGSCNIKKHRIWLNLELAKKSPVCLEYVVVHEMTHLWERSHNSRFKGLMDLYLPQWRSYRDTLNKSPSMHME